MGNWKRLAKVWVDVWGRIKGPLKNIGKFITWLIAFSIIISTFNFPILAESEDMPRLNHIPLVIWSSVTMLYFGIRSYRRSRSFDTSVKDGIAAAAIMYAGIALLSVVITDMSREIETIRHSPVWQFIVLVEVALIYAGTMIVIERTLDGAAHRNGIRRMRLGIGM